MNLTEQLELLIDGELLFHNLDQSPDGWKQCALGFLESQAWTKTLEKPAPIPVSKTRSWIAPLTGVAAAIVGVLLTILATNSEDLPNPLPTPEPIVEYLPLPAEKGISLTPASTEAGQLYFTTRKKVPEVFLHAFLHAGHDVEQIQHTINLPRESAPPLELPLTETRILINNQL